MKKNELVVLAIIVVSVIASIYLYPKMPEQMACHWNINGQVDDYMGKFWGLFLMPMIALLMFFLFALIPKIDPLKKNIKKFESYFDGFIVLIIIFFLYLHILVIAWNLGYVFNMNQMMPPALGILFFYCGILLKKAKRNWFVGIKTPWTLSSDKVWDKTHRLGSKLFMISGVIAFLSILIPEYSFWFIIVPILVFTLWLVVYSYIEHEKLKKHHKQKKLREAKS